MPSLIAAAWSGTSKGHVRERDIRQRRYLPQLTVGTEAADVIAVSIALTTHQEALNDYVAADEVITLECEIFEITGIEAVAAAFTMAETGDGAELSTTAQARLFITASSAGAATVSITDVAGASGKTIMLKVTPLSAPGFPMHAVITFD